MLILMLFAVIAGAGTAISPCVLPVLPALLSASATGGRRRPVGIVIGLATTFTVTIVGLASVVDGVGVANGTTRTLAVVALLLFGLALLVPAVGDRLEAPLSRLARFGPKSGGQGFWSGVVVGAALGFLYAPCAGPILAAVISVSASSGSSAKIVAIAISYAAGSAAVLLVLALGGRHLADRIRRAGRGPAVQRAVGLVMIATAVVIAFDYDVRFQTTLADNFPDFIVNPTSSIERSNAVERRLADIRGKSKFDVATAERQPSAAALPGVTRRSDLPVLGDAPDFTGNDRWFNTNGRALHLPDLRGRVVLVDFWTYTCINCIRTLPQLRAWNERYRARGLTIVGVHTPEFGFEHDAGNVADAIAQNQLTYPVAQDNEYATWNAYGNQFWPASYLIDARGKVRYTHFGEGDEAKTEAAIRSLLREARGGALGRLAGEHAEVPSTDLATPETYLGTDRAERFLPDNPTDGTRAYPGYRRPLPLSHLALGGTWNATGETATAVRNASLRLRFQARRVYLVLGAEEGMSRPVEVLLDGRPVRPGTAGVDVRSGRLDVRRQRLYSLVSLPRVERRTLTLRFAPGVSGYAFTFG